MVSVHKGIPRFTLSSYDGADKERHCGSASLCTIGDRGTWQIDCHKTLYMISRKKPPENICSVISTRWAELWHYPDYSPCLFQSQQWSGIIATITKSTSALMCKNTRECFLKSGFRDTVYACEFQRMINTIVLSLIFSQICWCCRKPMNNDIFHARWIKRNS